jgi:hypothetical protein
MKNGCIKNKCIDNTQLTKEWSTYDCPGWTEYFDDEAKAKYWYNDKTNEATWLPPWKRDSKIVSAEIIS